MTNKVNPKQNYNLCALQYKIIIRLLQNILCVFSEQFQNTTIEERVEILEGQVVIIQNEVSDLETDVNFLFDEQIIQDERLNSLEEETEEINDQLIVIDDDVESRCC